MKSILIKAVLFLLGAGLGGGGIYLGWAKPQIAAAQAEAQAAQDKATRTHTELGGQMEIANGRITADQQAIKSLQQAADSQISAALAEAKGKVAAAAKTAAAEKDRHDTLSKTVSDLQDQIAQAKKDATPAVVAEAPTPAPPPPPKVKEPTWRDQVRDQIAQLQTKLDDVKKRREAWDRSYSTGTVINTPNGSYTTYASRTPGQVPNDISDQTIRNLQDQIDRLTFQLN